MKIRVYSSDTDFIEQEVTFEPIIIGRGKQTDIRIISEGISRQHAQVYKEGDDCFIEDLASANGVLINGKKVKIDKLSPLFPAYLAGQCRVELTPEASPPRPAQKRSSYARRPYDRNKKNYSVAANGPKKVFKLDKNLIVVLISLCSVAVYFLYKEGPQTPTLKEASKARPIKIARETEKKAPPIRPKLITPCQEPWIRPLCLSFKANPKQGFGFFLANEKVVAGSIDYRKVLKSSPKAFDNKENTKKWLAEKFSTHIFKDLKREGIEYIRIKFRTRIFQRMVDYKEADFDLRAFLGAIIKSDGTIKYGPKEKLIIKDHLTIRRSK